jgi:LacI family transcriptional regulator
MKEAATVSVTMKDVARKAGVSIKTVSRVINNQGEISEETRERIMQIIEELGYRPNTLARGLLTGRTQSIGIIIPDITDPFFPDLILGAEQAARARAFNVFLCNANREPELELHYATVLKDRRVDGLMLVGTRLQPDVMEKIADNHRMVILSQYEIRGVTVFSLNDYEASYAVAEYLISLGHRRCAYLNGGWSGSSQRRLGGFIQAFADHGIPQENIITVPLTTVTHHQSYQATTELLADYPDVTAIACYNDILAIGAMKAAHTVGRRVPDDLSIVGYDDIPEASRTTPGLTTVHFDRFQIGHDMMNCLLDLVDGETSPEAKISLEGSLLERQSCARIV